MKAVLPHALEFYPMQVADLDAVAQIEAGIQAFPWSRGNFADSLHAGYSAWVARLPDRLIGFSVVMQVLDEAHIREISARVANIPKGVPGICKHCDEHFERLVGGHCGRCRGLAQAP